MGKLKAFFICAMSLGCPILICTSSSAGEALRNAAYFSSGALTESVFEQKLFNKTDSDSFSKTASNNSFSDPFFTSGSDVSNVYNPKDPINSENSENSGYPVNSENLTSDPPANIPVTFARVIEKNRTGNLDETDYSQFNKKNGEIYRYAFEKSSASNYIDLSSGAQLRNLTDKPNSLAEAASKQLPGIKITDPGDPGKPSVLIYHTHTTESFMPEGDTYDKDYPNRSRDDSRNMTAVGDALCKALAENGVTSVHDCTVHDYPQYTNSYSRSEKTILQNLEEYPSLKIMIDIHRDGIANSDGSLVAPVVEINGRSAAQFMIISGCDCDDFAIPHYLENLKLACLLQNTAETLYPGLARSVMFDYREYNQSLRPGILLIEVGSHGNSLDEAVYTGELLGKIIAEAVKQLED